MLLRRTASKRACTVSCGASVMRSLAAEAKAEERHRALISSVFCMEGSSWSLGVDRGVDRQPRRAFLNQTRTSQMAPGHARRACQFPEGAPTGRRQAAQASSATHNVSTAIRVPTPATSQRPAPKSRTTWKPMAVNVMTITNTAGERRRASAGRGCAGRARRARASRPPGPGSWPRRRATGSSRRPVVGVDRAAAPSRDASAPPIQRFCERAHAVGAPELGQHHALDAQRGVEAGGGERDHEHGDDRRADRRPDAERRQEARRAVDEGAQGVADLGQRAPAVDARAALAQEVPGVACSTPATCPPRRPSSPGSRAPPRTASRRSRSAARRVAQASCLLVVPELTRPWKPEIAPQAIVTNKQREDDRQRGQFADGRAPRTPAASTKKPT